MLNKNQIIELDITSLTSEGSGLGKYNGFAIFVPFTAIGDKISAKILKVKTNYAYAKIEKIISPSKDRIENDCPVFTKCGGCQFRHLSYEAEKKAKNQIIIDAFERIGKIRAEFMPFISNDITDGYRNKVQFPVYKDKSVVYGFYAPYSHRIVPINECKIQPKIFNQIADFVTKFCTENKISIYNEEKHHGVLRNIYIRQGHYSKQICVCLVARRNIPEFKKLSHLITRHFENINSIVININKANTNVILGEEEIVLYGSETISDKMCNNIVEISPKSFYQVNTKSAELLYSTAKTLALQNRESLGNVLELYCGIGTIGMAFADCSTKVIGVEIVPQAIENARRNAKANSINNIEFFCGDAEQFIKNFSSSIDTIIIDPPRKGCSAETLNSICRLSPEQIIMISCNPSTAARDCKILSDSGYKITKIAGVDLFPRTRHVETVVLMSRSKD